MSNIKFRCSDCAKELKESELFIAPLLRTWVCKDCLVGIEEGKPRNIIAWQPISKHSKLSKSDL